MPCPFSILKTETLVSPKPPRNFRLQYTKLRNPAAQLVTARKRDLLDKLILALTWSTSYSSFLEPAGSLPCSQKPATAAYPEPDESSPHLPTLFH